jgi:alpha-L-rhamnosidase
MRKIQRSNHHTSLHILLLCVCLLFVGLFTAVANPAQGATGLRCEYLVNPLGIDEKFPRFTWKLQDPRTGAKQSAWQVLVSTDSSALVTGKSNIWNSGKTMGSNNLVTYSGKKLQPFTRYYWTVLLWDHKSARYSQLPVAFFETGMMDASNWKGAWISDGKDVTIKPAPYFRTVFNATKKIRSARAYMAAAGLYELYLNGAKVGNHRLDPTYTRFDRRTLYVTYDVTNQLQEGKNAAGVVLGNGWYNHQSTAVWNFHNAPWRARPAFCLDLRITYEDGSTETITSGKNWKTSSGPIIFNSIYTAEHYDFNKELTGWNTVSYDDKGWSSVQFRAAPSQNIRAQVLHPIRNVEEVSTKSLNKINDTTYVFDIGRNIAGVSKIRLKGPAGTIVKLKHGERIYPGGHVDLSNIDVHYRPSGNDDPFQTDVVILGGKGEETFMPLFNYKGFQFVEVTSSAPLQLTKESVTAYFMHSDIPPAGAINTSNNVINGIWRAANNSYLSNLFGYPTDCPQREKNGWTGDAHIAVETGLYNFDGITVYEKWMEDHKDEQQPNGVLPSIIPTGGWGYEWGNGPDWTSTIAIIPWNAYLFYGDKKLLESCYENIRLYVDHINELYPSGLTTWGLGDWVPVKSKSPVEFTSSGYYFTDVTILSKAAKLLGKKEDHEKYSALALKIRNAINAKYLDRAKGIYGNGTQTELSFPLYWNIVPADMRTAVAANLARSVEADSFSLDVGLLGTKTILNALSENGYAGHAYRLASRETYPSWGWWIVNGATTLYENWKIDARNDISLNHIMFGEIGAWFYKGLGGILPDENNPGFRNIRLQPQFPEGLNHFDASFNSVNGLITSSWKRNDDVIEYKVVVPANCTADLRLPATGSTKISSGGQPLITGTGISSIRKSEDGFSIRLLSGTYHFTIK